MSFLKTHRGLGVAVLAGTLAAGGVISQAQNKAIPDAQVDASVLRQLATAPELSTQNIQSSTVYGTVTLTGTVQTEELRVKAENLASHADGVKKVVDELTLGDPGPANAAGYDNASSGQPGGQADGGYSQQTPGISPQGNATGSNPAYGTAAPGYNQPGDNPSAYNNRPYNNQPAYGSQPAPNQPAYGDNSQQANNQQPGYAPGAPEYGRTTPYSGQPYPPQRRPMYSSPAYSNGYAAPYAGQGGPGAGAPGQGQQGGMPVTVPGGSVIQVRINRGIDSNHIQPGAPFDGIVLNDVIAGGAVAIPRGATVQGTVIDVEKAGALKGRGELSLQINNLLLGGQSYPLLTAPWDREGADKTVRTVNSALGLGALGAIFGGVAGGGAGAAIGAGVGAGVGIAGSAASPGGRVIVPPESVLTFHLAQPTTVTTVSQQEMARLSYAAGPNPAAVAPGRRRYYSPNGYYYGPGPAPGYYRPY